MGVRRNGTKKQLDPRLLMWAWGSLEADFWRYYKMDLQQEGFSNRISWRKFIILCKGLPKGSAFQRWYSDKDNRNFAEWSEDTVFKEVKRVSTGREV